MNDRYDSLTIESFTEIADLLLRHEISLNNEAKEFLKNAPEGFLCCDTRTATHHYRHRIYVIDSDSGKRKAADTLLSENSELVRILARKSLCRNIVRITESNIKGLRSLKPLLLGDALELAMNSMSQSIRPLLTKNDISQKWMTDWMYAPYEKNESFPEELAITTLSGIKVRSKSEEKIADTLFNGKLAFRYEPKMIIGDEVRYPDFVILHPASNPDHMIFIIWEHAGKMDDVESYVPGLCRKMMLYSEAGLVIGENMIFTFENRRHPLSTAQVIREKSGIINMVNGSPIVERDGHFEISGMPAFVRPYGR